MNDKWDEVIRKLREARELAELASQKCIECEEKLNVARIKLMQIKGEIDGDTGD